MIVPWVAEEMKDVDLQDKRLNKRLQQLLSQLAGRPNASIPTACGGYAETTAAYRFFDNDKVGFENVLQPHITSTIKRVAAQPVVILAQDTTEIELTRPEEQVEGVGTLDGKSRFGVLFHPLVAFTPDGTPLGTLYAQAWTRDAEPTEPTSAEEQNRARKHTPIEEKESFRWLETYRRGRELAASVPNTQIICVADSEADIYELLEESQQPPQQVDWIIRACQDRALEKAAGNAEDTKQEALREHVLNTDVLLRHTVHVRGRKAKVEGSKRKRKQPRESRTIDVEVRAARVTLRAPWRPDRKLSDIEVNVVLATEVNPPQGEVPVEWMLLTSLPIDNPADALQVITTYCVRWMIEIFFRTLKSGCRMEDRRFEHVDRVFRCLAVYVIVTWRTLFVCRLSREFPDMSCDAVFEEDEWKSVYCIVKNQSPPSQPPKLQTMVRLVAQLGGYVNRARPDEPGPQTVWLGLQRTSDIARCWRTFGPEAKKQPTCV